MRALEHARSYYAATVDRVTDFPRLLGSHRADVCIVGAGFTGISTALHLAERGYDVRVVEANRVGWGASGRNGGQMIGGIAGERRIARHWGKGVEEIFGDLRWAGHQIIRERVQSYSIQCDLKFGYLDVAIKPRHMRALQADYEHLQLAGFPHECRLVSQEEAAAMTGTDRYIGGLVNMGNGHLHPLKLCVGEARAAVSRGATIYEQSPVTHIRKGTPAIVHTAQGSVSADAVIIAGNAYHRLDRRLLGLMLPVNSFISATEPLSEDVATRINPGDLAICDPNFEVTYFRLSADRRLLFGRRLDYFGSDPQVIINKHRPHLLKLYPQLADTRIDFAWGGTIGVPISRVPLMGRIGNNVFYSQGYSGHGVNVTHLAGRILADAVAGTMEQFDLFADVRPVVIPGMRIFAKPMVSLALLYYRIRDRL